MLARRRRRNRSGSVLALAAFIIIVAFSLLAFAVDVGYLQVIRAQLQTSADATALAAAWDLIDEGALSGTSYTSYNQELAWITASKYAGYNRVGGQSPTLEYGQDLQFLYTGDPSDPTTQVDPNEDPTAPPANTVLATVRKTSSQNGEVPLFFARVLGIDSTAMQASAAAMFMANLSGFTVPSSGGNLDIIPFALDIETWEDLVDNNVGNDDFQWDEDNGVSSGADGILEVNLFPQGTGSPGNRGTVDIGDTGNGVPDVRRQVLYGISAEDLVPHGGELAFDENGEIHLNGDTGISAGVKDALEQIVGQPRIIPLFSEVTGNGNNATYTIVQFAGIRIVEVHLTGSSKTVKRVMIQPASVSCEGMLPPTSTDQKGYFIHTPVYLVRVN